MSAGTDSESKKERLDTDTKESRSTRTTNIQDIDKSIESLDTTVSDSVTGGAVAAEGQESVKGGSVSFLEIDDAAIDKIISDVLGGAGGLAEIFSTEQEGGLFDSTAAAAAAGDLASKLTGEIARLTAKEVSEDFRVGTTEDFTRNLQLTKETDTTTKEAEERTDTTDFTRTNEEGFRQTRQDQETHGIETSTDFSLF